MCASCVGHATLASLALLLSRSTFPPALPRTIWVPSSTKGLQALLPLFCHLDSIALILRILPHLPLGSPIVLLAGGRATPAASPLRAYRPSAALRPKFTSESAAAVDPNLHLSNPRIGSPSSMRPCMLMHKGRPVLNRARHDYLALLHLKSHMIWHLPQVMTQLLSSLQ